MMVMMMLVVLIRTYKVSWRLTPEMSALTKHRQRHPLSPRLSPYHQDDDDEEEDVGNHDGDDDDGDNNGQGDNDGGRQGNLLETFTHPSSQCKPSKLTAMTLSFIDRSKWWWCKQKASNPCPVSRTYLVRHFLIIVTFL